MADARELAELLVENVRQLSESRRECAAYRLLAVQAIHQLHEHEVERRRLEASHLRLIEEYRSYRHATIRTSGRVA